jgi:hypothetical protein
MPDLNPAFMKTSVRQNGSWGHGITAATLGAAPTSGGTSYIQGYINTSTLGVDANGATCGTNSSSPFCNPGQFKLGDAPRTGDFGLRAPGVYNLNMSVRRQNVTNKVTFGGIGTNVDSSSFGTVSSATSNTGSRDFQFSGRLNF